MKKITKFVILITLNLFFISNICADNNKIWNFQRLKANFYAFTGLNISTGIVGNNDNELITGATKIGSKAGLRVELNVIGNKHHIETGLDIQNISQSIEYHDVQSSRDFKMILLRIPVTYNYHILKSDKSPFLIFKMGNYISFYPYKRITNNNLLPDYSINNTSRDFVFSFTCFPVNPKWGFSFEGMRSITKLYEDKYHQFAEDKNGGISGFTFGIQYKIK